MLFTSPTFLFGFLPLLLILYYVTAKRFKNYVLLLFSLFFYAWGEVFYLFIMLISISLNYFIGLAVYHYRHLKNVKHILYTGVLLNLIILIFFKYTTFILENINTLLTYFNIPLIETEPIHLPLGISFFTFQAISYIVDIYRNKVKPQHNIVDLALYISLFPQLIAGPIVRYSDISQQIKNRSHTINKISNGITRFIIGLAKKVLIANPLGEVVDTIFLLNSNELTMPIAWIGILFYTLQIYFDFSGYSDMAIGLGKIFGFKFLENFNYPYISTSLREFWQRWHISLSSWFRDYIYIPLGGNRVSKLRVYMNLFIVFIITGFWHGAAWNFLVWGLIHGSVLLVERLGLHKWLKKQWKFIQHFYLLSVVVISWVFFRAENISNAILYLKSMVNTSHFNTSNFQYAQILNNEVCIVFLIAVFFSMPLVSLLNNKFVNKTSSKITLILFENLKTLLIFFLFFLTLSKIAASTYNPFIYFRF